jgi:prolyl-tRNA synthetase
MNKTAIVPTREENFSEWYQEVIKQAELAQTSAVRGCMIIKPWGFALWENMQRALDAAFKKRGVENAYFPLFIPLKFLEKEAKHVEGFAKECAVVTHTSLVEKEGVLVPASQLDEPLVVRPTSETIIGDAFSKWIESYRDLPLKINQWCNIVRWEMRVRLFLRTTEILWQEGHTAHATQDEAMQQAFEMVNAYADFAKDYLAMPLIVGRKSAHEKFPGAEITYTIEAMMQDKKALQAGTSHYLGQNFSKAQEIQFRDEDGETKYAYTTSWGVTTRLIGALIMIHGDDNGCIIPPRIAPYHVIISPIVHQEKEAVLDYCQHIKECLEQIHYHGQPIEVKIDHRDLRGGDKLWSWVKKGAPIILEIGPKDLKEQKVALLRRDVGKKEFLEKKIFLEKATHFLDAMQTHLYERAKQFLKAHTKEVHSKQELLDFMEKEGGFATCYLQDDPSVDEMLKEWQLTTRCILIDQPKTGRPCILSGKENCEKMIVAKAY